MCDISEEEQVEYLRWKAIVPAPALEPGAGVAVPPLRRARGSVPFATCEPVPA